MPVKCRDIIAVLEDFAPPWLAEKWDNPGLLVGNPAQEVSNVLIALDVTPSVVDEAVSMGAELIVAHHPLIFQPLSVLRTDDSLGCLLAQLIRHDIAVFAAHTNLDAVAGGVSDVLAARLDLRDVTVLSPVGERLVKIVVFVPEGYVEQVRAAMTEAGAGHIGRYSHCTFGAMGTGTFKPLAGTNPFIGREGELTYTAECRLETIVPEQLLPRVVTAMRRVHPYEEVAYDLYPLLNRVENTGLGRLGRLPSPVSLADFARQVARTLAVPAVKVAGDKPSISLVAVCGGSGGDLVARAAAVGADVLVTGDVKYHAAQEAIARGLAVIDAGHFATEQPVLIALQSLLAARARAEGWTVMFHISRYGRDVFQVIQG